MPSLLTDMPDESLWAGDVIRLVDDHDLGPGARPVDLMLFDPRDGAGLGDVVLSGSKSGLILSVFPGASCGTGKRSLETAWLLRHWDDWFCYTYPRDEAGRLIPLPLERTLVIRPDEREISIKTDADRRPT